MNSGILGILTHQCPYQFPGLSIISTIFYVFDLVLFIFFSVVFVLRFALYRLSAYKEIVSNQADLMLFACWPIAFMTLTTLTGLICSNANWGRHAFTLVAYVMWWIECGWSLLVLFWVFITLIRRHEVSDRRLPTLVILPAVSTATVAVTGGLVVSQSYNVSPSLAVPVIIVSFMMVGLGVLLGSILNTFLFHGLLTQGWPAATQTTSIFILVGPMGQCAAALQVLGRAASTYGNFPGYGEGTFFTAQSAASLATASTLIALMLTGLGIIWMILSVYLMVERAVTKELRWTANWNSIIFPTGTLVTSMSLFALEMDSTAFRVVTAGMIIVLAIVFLVNLHFTVVAISKGELLITREDPRVKKMIEESLKEI